MKSLGEINSARQLLSALLSGQWPIHFKRQDRRMLEAQYQVLAWVLEHEDDDCFKCSMSSLKDLIGQIRFYENGRKYKSQALVE